MAVDMSAHKPRSYVRISGPKARALMHGLKVGGKHVLKFGGKVRSMNQSDYDDSIEFDMEHGEHLNEAPRSLTRAMKQRRNKGRFA